MAAVNTVLPYLIKVPNPMLRAELAGRLAERMRVDERLLRDELRRAAGEKRGEVHVVEEGPDANHAVKQLLRACLESEEMADALLPEIVESGVVDGLIGANVFTHLWEARKRNEKLNLADAEGILSPQEKRLAYDAVFWPGAPPSVGTGPGSLARASGAARAKGEREKLSSGFRRGPADARDRERMLQIQQDMSNLDKDLREAPLAPEKIRLGANELGYITSNF